MTAYASRHGTVDVEAVSVTEKLFEGLVGYVALLATGSSLPKPRTSRRAGLTFWVAR